jgi:hypothetical protein
MSLNGKLSVAIISCPDVLPDLWAIADLSPQRWKNCCSALIRRVSATDLTERLTAGE